MGQYSLISLSVLSVSSVAKNPVQSGTAMSDDASLPALSPERRRIAAGKFERANQVAATGNHDYAIKLLQECCLLDPANLIYRRALRQTQQARFKVKGGSALAFLTTGPKKLRLQAARRSGDHLKVLECAEQLL